MRREGLGRPKDARSDEGELIPMAGASGWQKALDASLEMLVGVLSHRVVENVPRALTVMQRLTTDPTHRKALQAFRERWERDEALRRQAQVLARNPKMIQKVRSEERRVGDRVSVGDRRVAG